MASSESGGGGVDHVEPFDRLPISELGRQMLVDIEHLVGARHQIVRLHRNRQQHCPQHRHTGQKDIGGTRHIRLLRPRTPRALVNIVAHPTPRNAEVVATELYPIETAGSREFILMSAGYPLSLQSETGAQTGGTCPERGFGFERGHRDASGHAALRRTREAQRTRLTP